MGKKHICIKINKHSKMKFYIKIPFSEPSTDDCLTIKIYDYDSMQSDELVGVCSLKKSNILEGKVKFLI